MAEVVVVGAGLGGLAAAARIAKLGHRVTLCERTSEPGGLLRAVADDASGGRWDAVPFRTSIPAVLRDLFRKSGRPLERYAELRLATPLRRHVFGDGSTLKLPSSRGDQTAAITADFGPSAGAAWTSFVDGQADRWSALRTHLLDPAEGPAQIGVRRVQAAVGARRSLTRELARALPDAQLRALAAWSSEPTAGRAEDEPALRSVDPYVDRTFGVWQLPGGAADLSAALLTRMRERGVEVSFDTEVTGLVIESGAVGGVRAGVRSIDADVVVAAVAPRLVASWLPDRRAARLLETDERKRLRRVTTHVLLREPVDSELGSCDVVLHGSPPIAISPGPQGDPLHLSVTHHGRLDTDVIEELANRGLDLRSRVAGRVERITSAGDGETAPALPWLGTRDAAARAALATPLPGLHCLGFGLLLGGGPAYVAWEAARVAERLGRVARVAPGDDSGAAE